jgi:hypothetical protein
MGYGARAGHHLAWALGARSPSMWDVMEHTNCVAKGEIAPKDLLEEISLPGVPEGVD